MFNFAAEQACQGLDLNDPTTCFIASAISGETGLLSRPLGRAAPRHKSG